MEAKAELEALNNALISYNLTGYKIKEFKLRINKSPKYFLLDDNGGKLTGTWSYDQLNHFIMGYGKAFNRFNGTIKKSETKRKRFDFKI